MSKEPKEYLRHIQDECSHIISVSEKLVYEDFLEDETLKRAVVRSLEIIGEATKKIPADIKVKWNTIQWKNMAGMRDRLIHDYLGVNYAIVWDVMKNKIPDMFKTDFRIPNRRIKTSTNN
ncbi:HepT-like ribonuclease domain-containing protein [Flavobacterium sp. TSSA_36]|uniref:HepT-like ribonuclease domain-containing protein n=1 Tax=Flavobacterium sp. TSSA_36 TaxID=3447669 RepID=UPI003F36BB25